MLNLANVDRIGQHSQQRSVVEDTARTLQTFLGCPRFRSPLPAVQFDKHRRERPVLRVEPEDLANPLRLALVDH